MSIKRKRKGKKQEKEETSVNTNELSELMDFVSINEIESSSVEMLDMQVEANEIVVKMLENRIKVLEAELKIKEVEIENLKRKESQETSLKSSPIQKHLSSVQEKHINLLKGYRMIYKTKPNGACAQNASAVMKMKKKHWG